MIDIHDTEFNINDLGIGVELLADYSIVCETLERIGIVNEKEKKIYPSCYCYKKENSDGDIVYRICHFKELFCLQGKKSTFNKLDMLRLKTIVYFLQKWNLIKVINSDDIDKILQDKISVVSYANKKQYKICHKFRHGPDKL